MNFRLHWWRLAGLIAAAGLACYGLAPAWAAWEPTRPVEFMVPAGTGGGADQMARTIQGIISKHGLMKQSLVVINKAGGAGGEAFLDAKGSRGNPHKLLITLSNLFTTPLGSGIPFSWRDLTPIAMLALDEFVLWVNAERPYQTVRHYIDAAKKAPQDARFRMGGTGSKQEDQIITVAIEKSSGAKFNYIPYRGGGEVALQLVGNHVDSSVNNPIEAVAHWRGGQLRPLCVFDNKVLEYHEKIAADKVWSDIPTCKSQGLDIAYLMLRGVFMPPSVTGEQVTYYVELLEKVRGTLEWKELMRSGAFNQTFMTGRDYTNWLETTEQLHRTLMQEAGFLYGN